MNHEFVIERGIKIYEKPKNKRSGKWKELALKMAPPEGTNGETIYDSVSKTADGHGLTLKQSIALVNAMSRLGYKGVSRRNQNGSGYRVWRTA